VKALEGNIMDVELACEVALAASFPRMHRETVAAVACISATWVARGAGRAGTLWQMQMHAA